MYEAFMLTDEALGKRDGPRVPGMLLGCCIDRLSLKRLVSRASCRRLMSAVSSVSPHLGLLSLLRISAVLMFCCWMSPRIIWIWRRSADPDAVRSVSDRRGP